MVVKNHWYRHLKDKLVSQQSDKNIEECATTWSSKRKERGTDDPSSSSEVISHSMEDQNDHEDERAQLPTLKRAKTGSNPLCHLQNIEILKNCKELPFIMELATSLEELNDTKDTKMLCKILGIANKIRSKGTRSSVLEKEHAKEVLK